jgi:hypothetical protein
LSWVVLFAHVALCPCRGEVVLCQNQVNCKYRGGKVKAAACHIGRASRGKCEHGKPDQKHHMRDTSEAGSLDISKM